PLPRRRAARSATRPDRHRGAHLHVPRPRAHRRRPHCNRDVRGREPARRARRAQLHPRGVRLHGRRHPERVRRLPGPVRRLHHIGVTMDLAGGMELTEDEVTTTIPPTPEYREGTSMWIWDDAGRVGLPRIAVEALGATWETSRNASVNVVLPDGR